MLTDHHLWQWSASTSVESSEDSRPWSTLEAQVSYRPAQLQNHLMNNVAVDLAKERPWTAVFGRRRVPRWTMAPIRELEKLRLKTDVERSAPGEVASSFSIMSDGSLADALVAAYPHV